MKKYIKPEIKVAKIYQELIAASSKQEQCECYQYLIYGGCVGCPGHCGCNHWDEELLEIVPGC